MDTIKIREANISFLKNNGIEMNYELPFMDIPVIIRGKEEIAYRMNVLHILYAIYLDGEKSKNYFYNEIKRSNWEIYLSEKEKQILNKKNSFFKSGMDKQDLIDFSWKKESLFPLLWSIGGVQQEALYQYDREIILSDYYSKIPPENPFEKFLKQIDLLSVNEIVKATDLYYLLHWSVMHDKISKGNGKHQFSLIIERRRALEWIIDPESDWDDISLDT